MEPNFGKPGNWPLELGALAPFAIVALASTPSILSGGGGLDISIGPLTVLVNVIMIEWFLPHSGLSNPVVAILLCMLIGTAVGTVNGVLISVLRYQPVIATLCTFFVLAGVIAKVAPTPKSVAGTHGHWTTHLADKVGPIPGALILIAIPLVIWFVLSRTSYHRNLYSVGGNDATAFSAGIDVTRVRVMAYALGGCFAGVAGVALTALVQSDPIARASRSTRWSRSLPSPWAARSWAEGAAASFRRCSARPAST